MKSVVLLLGFIFLSRATAHADPSLDRLVGYLRQFDAVALCEVVKGSDGQPEWQKIDLLLGCWAPPPLLNPPRINAIGERLVIAACHRKKGNLPLIHTMNLRGGDIVTSLDMHEGPSFGIRVNYRLLKRALMDAKPNGTGDG